MSHLVDLAGDVESVWVDLKDRVELWAVLVECCYAGQVTVDEGFGCKGPSCEH